MLEKVKSFIKDERGAITIEWVILVAGIVVMAVFTMSLFRVDVDGVTFSDAGNGQIETNAPNVVSLMLVNTRDLVNKWWAVLADGGQPG